MIIIDHLTIRLRFDAILLHIYERTNMRVADDGFDTVVVESSGRKSINSRYK
jgi:hypothetical protein